MYDLGQEYSDDFKALFEAAPGAYLVLTPELRIAGASQRYLDATMTRREDILGRDLFDVFPDDPADTAADGTSNLGRSLQQVIASGAPHLMAVQHYPIRRPDGTFESRYWRPGNYPVLGPDGRLRLIIHHVEDVTRQQAAEQAARQLALGPEAALAAFFDGMFEGVQVIDLEGRYAYLNATALAQGRRSREELLGVPMAQAYPGIEQTEMYRLLLACLHERRPQSLLNRFKYPDGSERSFDLRMEPVPMGALILSADVSDRMDLEDALRSAERLEAVGRLAGGIAHDFNNLVTIISGYAALLHKTLPPEDPRSEDLAQIQVAGQRAAELTRQLLAFSRKQVLEPKVMDLNASLSSVSKLLKRVIGEDIEINVQLAEGLAPICADPGQVEQIILNLALNARDAMPEGGKLTLETADARLDEAYAAGHSDAKPGPHVMLAVTDTGHGMDPEVQRRIFEPFFTTKQLGRGTGLGLATVHGIVKQSGGNIWVYSEPSKGTCFKVYFPASDAVAEPALGAAAAGADAPKGSGRILLVEDEPGVRRLFESVLSSAGYQVTSAPDSDRALAACRAKGSAFDLLLTDMVLPGMGGKRLAEEVKGLCPAIKVVFMSGYTDTAIVHQGALEPGTAFISKPVSPAALLEKLRAFLGPR